MTSNKIRKEPAVIVFYSFGIVIVSMLALLCLLPFVLMVTGSFSDNARIMVDGYSLLPRGFTLHAYETLFERPKVIFDAYSVTIAVTVIGTLIGALTIAMTGYVLSRPDFEYRDGYSFFIYFTTLFSGGLIPWYIINTQVLGLKNSLWALILPSVMNAFFIFLFKNFMRAVPHDLVESARMDGASEFRIFLQIMMPLSKPAIATIALFNALHYWNDWFTASLLITQEDKYPLQYFLFRMLSNSSVALDTSVTRDAPLPTETIKLAMAIITTGPVMLFYPFAQKYFVTGLTVGSVKG
jgi:putative aldouronate transport system permease protein